MPSYAWQIDDGFFYTPLNMYVCTSDWFKIIDVHGESIFCQDIIPDDYYSTTNELQVEFGYDFSDDNNEPQKGFSVTYFQGSRVQV